MYGGLAEDFYPRRAICLDLRIILLVIFLLNLLLLLKVVVVLVITFCCLAYPAQLRSFGRFSTCFGCILALIVRRRYLLGLVTLISGLATLALGLLTFCQLLLVVAFRLYNFLGALTLGRLLW